MLLKKFLCLIVFSYQSCLAIHVSGPTSKTVRLVGFCVMGNYELARGAAGMILFKFRVWVLTVISDTPVRSGGQRRSRGTNDRVDEVSGPSFVGNKPILQPGRNPSCWLLVARPSTGRKHHVTSLAWLCTANIS